MTEQAVVTRPLVDVRLDGLSTHERDGSPPLRNVSVRVRYGEFFTFLGPRCSGKTALVRAIAGFTPLAAGRVVVDGHDVTDLPPARREFACVFQEGALWPHLSVAEHVAFGLKQKHIPAAEVLRRVGVVLGRLGLTAAAGRLPEVLTVDERRRLALARALAVEPRVLLLDEPLAHVEPSARKSLRLELARLHRDLAVTTIHVTRDAADALALSDRIAILTDGRVLQTGEPEELYRRPQSRAIAETLGPANFVPVRVVEVRDLGVVVETERGDHVPVSGIGAFSEGGRGLLVMRPETLLLTEASVAIGPGLPGRVALRVFEGARYLYEIDIGASESVRVEVAASEAGAVFRLGDAVRIGVSSETVVLVPDEASS